MGELQTFQPEQVMAMLLTKLKDTAEKGLKTKVADVVVSVSSPRVLSMLLVLGELFEQSRSCLCRHFSSNGIIILWIYMVNFNVTWHGAYGQLE